MRIAKELSRDTVLLGFEAENREAAVKRLVDKLASLRPVDTGRAMADLTARERICPTLIPVGRRLVAIAHAHTPACKQLCMAIGVSGHGIPWDSAGSGIADAVALILSPPQMHALYLKVLSRFARFLENPDLLESILSADSAEKAIALIEEAEQAFGDIVAGDDLPTFCVLGAGHGGLAMAAHLSLSGCRVNLFNRTASRIESVAARGGIDVDGEIRGFASLNVISTDPAQAVDQCDILMIVVPAVAHRDMARIIAPHVKDGQIVVLNPGRTGGALEVAKVFGDVNPGVRPYIAEAQTLLYAARATNPGQVHIFGIKNSVPLASLPAYHIVDILPIIRKVLPQFVPGDNILKTSLDNIGAVFHPAITVLNAGRIEDTHGGFEYYIEGVTPAVAKVLEGIDAERVAVAAALGIRATTAREWLYLAYDAPGKTLLEAMRANAGYRGINAPGTIQHRYIAEDVPASLVPIASIGEMMGVPTPMIISVINLASAMHGVDYWAEGRTVERLGIAGMSVRDIRFLVVGAETGVKAEAGLPGYQGGPRRKSRKGKSESQK